MGHQVSAWINFIFFLPLSHTLNTHFCTQAPYFCLYALNNSLSSPSAPLHGPHFTAHLLGLAGPKSNYRSRSSEGWWESSWGGSGMALQGSCSGDGHSSLLRQSRCLLRDRMVASPCKKTAEPRGSMSPATPGSAYMSPSHFWGSHAFPINVLTLTADTLKSWESHTHQAITRKHRFCWSGIWRELNRNLGVPSLLGWCCQRRPSGESGPSLLPDSKELPCTLWHWRKACGKQNESMPFPLQVTDKSPTPYTH